jgi:hypothetical protein
VKHLGPQRDDAGGLGDFEVALIAGADVWCAEGDAGLASSMPTSATSAIARPRFLRICIRSGIENNSRTETPKHDAKPGRSKHQKAGPAVNTYNPAKSAKPPSPVQIRAAPPKSFVNIREDAFVIA